MLIAIECHARGITPTYVAGFRAFLQLNRCVRKGLGSEASRRAALARGGLLAPAHRTGRAYS